MAGVHGIMFGGGFVPMLATGGTVSEFTDGDGVKWRVHIFNSSGALNVSRLGTLRGYVQRLVVGGGAGGGSAGLGAGAGGGGGAGDHLGGGDGTNEDDYAYLTVAAHAAVVGSGGALNTNGGDSSFAGLTAIGGGAGGRYGSPATFHGRNGGSGGGAGQPGENMTANGGTDTGDGHPGGKCVIPPGKETGGGGGGGGAGGPGEDANGTVSPINGGDGGLGKVSSITGTAVTRAAGGGGAGCNRSSESGTGNGEPGLGGSSIGGNGAKWEHYAATAPVENTGSGGGGAAGGAAAHPAYAGTPGAKGVVIVRYPLTAYQPPHL